MTNEEGTIQQANEIKYLLKQLQQERAKASAFKSKYENEKILRLKTTKAMKKYKRKYTTLSTKFEKSPIFKEFILQFFEQETKWSPQCLKLATQIRYAGKFYNYKTFIVNFYIKINILILIFSFTVGWKSYLYLRKNLGLPLPSYSTICRYITKLDFQPGILIDVLSLMSKKIETHESSHQKDCVILMDEMDIQPGLEYDVSIGKLYRKFFFYT